MASSITVYISFSRYLLTQTKWLQRHGVLTVFTTDIIIKTIIAIPMVVDIGIQQITCYEHAVASSVCLLLLCSHLPFVIYRCMRENCGNIGKWKIEFFFTNIYLSRTKSKNRIEQQQQQKKSWAKHIKRKICF